MSVKQHIESEATTVKHFIDTVTEETYIFEQINNSIISYPLNGNPMWTGTTDKNNYTTEHYKNECLIVDEATTPMSDLTAPASNDGYDQQNSDIDLNNITPSLMLMYPQSRISGPPDRTQNPGLYNFAVLINSANTHKKKFLWSNKVKRMYVDAGIDFPLNFSWEANAPKPAFVRAMVVFYDADQSQSRVETCLNHKSSLAAKNLPDYQLSNVLHSSREAGANDVFYCGGSDQWYSTVVRYDDNPRTHAYRFICKNSCTGGINRRSIAIIFTLEDEKGTVFGREEISVRVCACPRRDMKADEDALGNKKPRPADAATEPRAKKVKIEPTDGDDRIVVLPELRIRGVSTALRILEMAREFAVQHKRLSADPQVVAEDAGIIADVDAKISELKK